MIPGKIQLIAMAVGLSSAFFAGWQVNGWRLDAAHVKELESRVEGHRQAMADLDAAWRAMDAARAEREAKLGEQLESERLVTIELRREIDNAVPQIVTRRVEVPGQCEPIPRLDLVRFTELYRRATAGTLPDPDTGNPALP